MPVRNSIERHHKPRSGMFLGGIGTGGLELCHDGECHTWSIFNNAPLNGGARLPRHMRPNSLFFIVVRVQEEGREPLLRLLQVEDVYGAGGIIDHPHYYIFPWLRGIQRIDWEASFPFVTLQCQDPDLPVEVRVRAWSPFIPHDIKNSSLPCACFDCTVTSTSKRPVQVSVVGTLRNAVAYDVPERVHVSQRHEGDGYVGFSHNAGLVPTGHQSAGSMGLAMQGEEISHHLGWEHRHPYYEHLLREPRLPDTDDTDGRNPPGPDGRPRAMQRCFSSVADTVRLIGAGAGHCTRLTLAWSFPNRQAVVGGTGAEPVCDPSRIEGHYHSNFFDHASEVLDYVIRNRSALHERTADFHTHFFDSTAPDVVLDQVNSHLNTFISSAWLNRAGVFGILEGLDQERSYAGLCTTDVAMYGGVMTAALFPELEMAGLRHHRALQAANGQIRHGFPRNSIVEPAERLETPRLDMPAQYAFQVLRSGLWADDEDFLRECWPAVCAALDYGLRERDQDGDGLPDMGGIMSSYDNLPMHGMAPYVAGQWLVAYRAAILVAEHLDDAAAAARYGDALRRGRISFEERGWNDDCYRLWHRSDGSGIQADEGCLSDQLLGLWAADQLGLDDCFEEERARQALRTVVERNLHPVYGLRNCTWPEDQDGLHPVDPDTWVDQANTVWSGVELACAATLMGRGLVDEALRVVQAVDERYRDMGLYFDHQEYGGHYYRPMSAWSLINAMLGLSI
ncbi:MAG: GH116 family glycosyl hydrolase, partial [Planctomycetota bacterium]